MLSVGSKAEIVLADNNQAVPRLHHYKITAITATRDGLTIKSPLRFCHVIHTGIIGICPLYTKRGHRGGRGES